MVRQEPLEYLDSLRERPSVSPGADTLISDVRISVLDWDSIVNDVALITPKTICVSNSSNYFCDINSLKHLAGKAVRKSDAPSRGLVINWLADDI